MSHRRSARRLTRLGAACLFVVAALLSGPHDPARAGFKSVSECQGIGDSNSGPSLLARIQCYNDVMAAISFQREKAQHLSDMVKAIQGTLAGDAAKTCLSEPYDRIIASSNGGFCSAEWNTYRTRLVELESYGCRNQWMPLSEEAKSFMPTVDDAKRRYEACFEDALLNGKIAVEQIQLYQIRSRDHFKEVYFQVVKDWQLNGATYTSQFHEHLTACKADGEFLQQRFPASAPGGRIICGSD